MEPILLLCIRQHHLFQFILGVVEGVTEFLPISSTGHLILTARLLGMEPSEFLKSFEIVIQSGAICAVLFLYGGLLLKNPQVLKKVLAAFVPTAIVGAILYKVIKHFFLGNENVVLWSMFVGGIFLVLFELIHKEKEDAQGDLSAITYSQACLIGLAQSLAMIPGVSRAAATIIGGLLLGLKRRTIVEFSFLLAIPTMLAATGLDLIKSAHTFSANQFVFLATGFIISLLVAVLSIKFLLYYIKNHSFIPFGIYRILIAVIFWIWLAQ